LKAIRKVVVMLFRILLGSVLAWGVSLGAYAAPDTAGKLSLGARTSWGLEAPNLVGSGPIASGRQTGLLPGYFSLGYGFTSAINASIFLGYDASYWLTTFRDSEYSKEESISEPLTGVGFQLDYVVLEFAQSRLLAGVAFLFQDTHQTETGPLLSLNNGVHVRSYTLTPALSYEHFLGDNFSVSGGVTLPMTFSAVTWRYYQGPQIDRALTSFNVVSAFEPLVYIKYYF
jgi:hypothetical protein